MMMQSCWNCLFLNVFRQGCRGSVCSTSERLSARLSMDLTATQSLLTTKKKIDELMSTSGIIRNRAKIKAAISNTSVFKSIQEEFGSFDAYLSGFCPKEPVFDHTSTTSTISDSLSADLRKRGMKFVGSTTIHAFLQSIGVFNSHEPDCYLYRGK